MTASEPLAFRLQPPAHLAATEAQLFREVVANAPSGHFSASDVYLLATFCQITATVRQAARNAAKANANDRQVAFKTLSEAAKTQALIATKLRLVPSARISPRTAGRHHDTHRPSAYDEMRMKGWDI